MMEGRYIRCLKVSGMVNIDAHRMFVIKFNNSRKVVISDDE